MQKNKYMRIIKFRALDKRGIWHYGYLWEAPDNTFYIKERIEKTHDCDYEVIKETVGEFTGLKDKNGVEIYEGDVVEFYYLGWHKSEIKFIEYGYFVETTGHTDDVREKLKITFPFKNFEVIGNIYQNPELLTK